MNEVSICCGCGYEDSTMADCCSVEMIQDSDICPACKEHTQATGYICNECDNWFEETEDEHEYNERMRENVEEARWEERTGR